MIDYKSMEAGQEMDFEVEYEVLGIAPRFKKGLGGIRHDPKPYSSDIAMAWEVLEYRYDDVEFCRRFHANLACKSPLYELQGWKAAETICRAALEALEAR